MLGGKNSIVSSNQLHVHIHRIRKLFEEKPKQPKYLLTVRGIGYILYCPENNYI
ncbi:winged helix-turn-helix domain-containing protein [Effusibacillus consociatus]|uniref:Helix-turn-helix domain-containing protein n=1 Tax=Effusibacillus consociatus TaxID=1117041 RepID=A0ABV9PYW5_9BACL